MSYDTALTLLTNSALPYNLHEHVVSQTVADAREKLNFPLERLLKTIAFKDKAGHYYLVAVRGPDQIDYRKLADATGVKRAELAQIQSAEITEVFGVEVGSVGPLPAQTGAIVFFDSSVTTNETVFCGIGRPDRTLEIQLADLLTLTNGKVAPLVKTASTPSP